MTAEVAALNKGAVAFAADSKVTIVSSGGEKTYDTMNKIFTLSKVQPVGIMIYGNADFMEYPWETIIKLYRGDKKDKHDPTIVQWGDDFWRFVGKFGPIQERERSNNIRGILSSVFSSIHDEAINTALESNISIGSKEYHEIVFQLMKRRIDYAYKHKKWASVAFAKQVTNKYSQVILEQVSGFQKNSKCFDAGLELCTVTLLQEFFSEHRSGIVIAGFGEKEVFPSMVHYWCDGYIGRRLKTLRLAPVNIRMDMRSCVQAFAQSEIVARFMEGIDPGYSNVLQGLFRTSLIESNLATFTKWAPKSKQNARTKNRIERAAEKQFNAIHDKAVGFRNSAFTSPILDMVALLPKDELASLAESLVSLTSLHRRVSRELETVGGAVDVAVISKSDGFVWIKRKHYFRKELNPQFDLNYMRNMQGGRR